MSPRNLGALLDRAAGTRVNQNEATLVTLDDHEGTAVRLIGEVAFRDTIASPFLAYEPRKGRGNEVTPGSNHIKFSTINGVPRTSLKNLQHTGPKQRSYNSYSRGNSSGFDMQQRLILRRFKPLSEILLKAYDGVRVAKFNGCGKKLPEFCR
jgi:hypothetical protein